MSHVACDVEEAMKQMRGYGNTQGRGASSGASFRYQGGGGVIPHARAFGGANSAQASNSGTRNSQGSMSTVAKPSFSRSRGTANHDTSMDPEGPKSSNKKVSLYFL